MSLLQEHLTRARQQERLLEAEALRQVRDARARRRERDRSAGPVALPAEECRPHLVLVR